MPALLGSRGLEDGIITFNSVELTYVAVTVAPFTAAVEFAMKFVPVSVTVVAVLIGPALGEIFVSVGMGLFTVKLTAVPDPLLLVEPFQATTESCAPLAS
jgi:hypothetical protein